MPEKTERIKYIPIHQHINCERVEICFMTSSMLIEMPMIYSKRSNSKFFKKLLDNYEKNVNIFKLAFLHLRKFQRRDLLCFLRVRKRGLERMLGHSFQ